MMNNNSNHLDEQTVQRYVMGQLSQPAMEAVLHHLEQCDQCLERVEQLWGSERVGLAVASEREETAVSSQQREQRLVNRIHRSNLGGTVVEVSLNGFLDVIIALLRPILGTPVKKRARGER